MTSRSIPANRSAIARTYRTLKFTFSTPVISHWTLLQMRSPHWSEPLSLLHAGSCRRGAPADAAIENAGYLSSRRKTAMGERNSKIVLLTPNESSQGRIGDQKEATTG